MDLVAQGYRRSDLIIGGRLELPSLRFPLTQQSTAPNAPEPGIRAKEGRSDAGPVTRFRRSMIVTRRCGALRPVSSVRVGLPACSIEAI